MSKILLIEDNLEVRENTAEILELARYSVVTAENGKVGVELALQEKPDLIICDIMMPVLDGYGVLHMLSKNPETSTIPFIFLTAKSMKDDKLTGFSAGADDYLTKPFSMEELLARINAIMRRVEAAAQHKQEKIFIGKIEYEPELRLLQLEEGPKKLTTKENQLLHLLVRNQNDILDRQATLRAIWGDDNYFNGRSMDVYIAKLRKLLREDPNLEIMNVHGKGFKLIVKREA